MPTVSVGDGASCGKTGWTLWGRGLGMWANRPSEDGYLGVRQGGGGAAVGADGLLNSWLRLGVAMGVSRTDLSFSRANYGGDQEALHAGLYGQATFGEAFVRASVNYARLNNDTTRAVVLGSVNGSAKADYDGDLFGAGLAAGYDWRFSPNWLLEPLAALEYQYVKEYSFTESGIGWLGYNIDDRDDDSFLSRLGVRLTRMIKTENWELLPRVGVAWRHQFATSSPSLTASFLDYSAQGFSVEGAAPVGDMAEFEAGFTVGTRDCVSFYTDYRLSYADDYQVQTLSIGLQYNF